jgi:hypothetical protein
MLLLLPQAAWAQDPRTEAADKSAAAMLPSTTQAIDWDAARRDLARSGVRAMAPKVADAADGMGMPVLVPARAEWLASATWVTGPGWYTMNMRDDRVDVSVHGASTWTAAPAGMAAAPTTPWQTTVVDGITTVSFLRYGVAYTVDIECRALPAASRTDPLVGGSPCMSAEDVSAMMGSLVVAGGKP